jgi:hypothetical protein
MDVIKFPESTSEGIDWDAPEPPWGCHPNITLLFKARDNIVAFFDVLEDYYEAGPHIAKQQLQMVAGRLAIIADLMPADYARVGESRVEAYRKRYYEKKQQRECPEMDITMMVRWNGREFEARIEDIEAELPMIVGRFKTMDEATEQGKIALKKAIEERELAWASWQPTR